MRGCMATPVAQTQAPKGMSLVSFVCELTTLTLLALTDATRLFSTRSMPSLHHHKHSVRSRDGHGIKFLNNSPKINMTGRTLQLRDDFSGVPFGITKPKVRLCSQVE